MLEVEPIGQRGPRPIWLP